MEEEIKKYIQDVRPSLQADGGDVEFVRLENNIAYVKLKGSCHGCPMARVTLKQGIERYLKEKVPGLVSVESV
ncbi:MAG: NifU family protein [Spirochaetales bacterium]|nr:NifU family protein [Spirochaetales bacterium]